MDVRQHPARSYPPPLPSPPESDSEEDEDESDESDEDERGGQAVVVVNLPPPPPPPAPIARVAEAEKSDQQPRQLEEAGRAGGDQQQQQQQQQPVAAGDEQRPQRLQEQIPTIGDRYVVHGKIDRGTFSTVSLATRREEAHLDREKRRMYAIKLITETSHPTRIERELRCMMQLGGRCNVVGIVDAFRHQGSVALVMKYIPHEPFQQYFAELTPAEVQRYMQNLLIPLRRVHQYGVIHRDVKPSNFLHARRHGGYMLVDFGLAQETTCGEFTLRGGPVKQQEAGAAAATGPSGGVAKTDKRKVSIGDDGSDRSGALVAAREDALPAQQQQQQQQVSKRHKTNGSSSTENNTPDELARRMGANSLSVPQAAPVPPLQQRARPCSPLKLSNSVAKDGLSALARQIKSTVAGISQGLKQYQESRRPAVPAPAAAPPAPAPVAARAANAPPGAAAARCECCGRPRVCNACLVKRELFAPRAGTPGYRPPEVLLKYPDQTTAVDIWAVGVIFLSILSACYPFFGNTDDLTSLAQIVCVFGYDRIGETARLLDRKMLVDEHTMQKKPLNLRKVCRHFRALHRRRLEGGGIPPPDPDRPGGDNTPVGEPDEATTCANCELLFEECVCETPAAPAGGEQEQQRVDGDDFGEAAYDLLARLLEINPHKRITAAEALEHPFFQVKY
ncbi:cell division cycle 7-related protein kinase [Anopheles bellator]|uniref:cell division cycle 7-related protein kinase n=1 Tax=Anopheles bellator TaxID=139047 RepID=UPI00264A04F6|nr:cell division cycle 7-related protein kinase [Anopheles bellator]